MSYDVDTICQELLGHWVDDNMVTAVDLRLVAAEVITRLPEDVQDFAMDEVYWVAISKHNLAFFFPLLAPVLAHLEEGTNWLALPLIVLSPSLEDMPLEQIRFTFAHEIAHAWLKHAETTESSRREGEADDLAREWGFPRPEGLADERLSA
jgi:hypothetical protein